MNSRIKNSIPFPLALWTVIILSTLVLVFHFLILLMVIPFELVWAGRLKSVEEMFVFESISIVANAMFIFVVLVKAEFISINIPIKIINTVLWIFVVLFALNTLGNLTSKTSLETFIATPLTFILAILCWRLAVHSK